MQNNILAIVPDNKTQAQFQKEGIVAVTAFDSNLFRKMEQANIIYIQAHQPIPQNWFSHGGGLHGGYHILLKAIKNNCNIRAKIGFFSSGGILKPKNPNIQILQSESIPYHLNPPTKAAPNTWAVRLSGHNRMRNFENIRDSFDQQTTPPEPSLVQKIFRKWL